MLRELGVMKEIGDNFFTFVALDAKGKMDNGHAMLRHFSVPFFRI